MNQGTHPAFPVWLDTVDTQQTVECGIPKPMCQGNMQKSVSAVEAPPLLVIGCRSRQIAAREPLEYCMTCDMGGNG
jgi:hypothetical protein